MVVVTRFGIREISKRQRFLAFLSVGIVSVAILAVIVHRNRTVGLAFSVAECRDAIAAGDGKKLMNYLIEDEVVENKLNSDITSKILNQIVLKRMSNANIDISSGVIQETSYQGVCDWVFPLKDGTQFNVGVMTYRSGKIPKMFLGELIVSSWIADAAAQENGVFGIDEMKKAVETGKQKDGPLLKELGYEVLVLPNLNSKTIRKIPL